MRSAWKAGLAVLVFSSVVSCAQAAACSGEERAGDVRHSLPADIERTLPAAMGVEAVASHTIQGEPLLAAIIVPEWYFSLCDGGKAPDNDSAARELRVWRHTVSGWLEIGRNSSIVYGAATAGQAHVSLNWYGDNLSLVQYSYPQPGAARSDNYDFVYEAAAGKIRLAYRMSSSFFYPMCCGGNGEGEYAAAKEKYGGDACDYEGYKGEINYLSGEAVIVQCGFARRQVSRALRVHPGPVYLDAMQNMPLDEVDLLQPSGRAAPH